MPKKAGLIDERDKKILSILEQDARQTDSTVAKKAGLSKQVVNYRIQKMTKSRVISNFYTVVNVGNLGLSTYYVFIQLKNLNKEKERKILEKINSLDSVGWLVSCIGRWNVILNVNESSVLNFEKTLNTIIKLFGDSIHDYKFTLLLEAEHIGYKFLSESRKIFEPLYQGEGEKMFRLDITDEKILRGLSQDARQDLISLSDKIKIPVHILHYRLKRMIKNKVIEGFKPKLNIGRLGYQWYLLLMKLSVEDEEGKKGLAEFCKGHKNIYYVTSTIGEYNLMLDVHVNSVEELNNLVSEIKNKFPETVQIYESMTIIEEFKIDYLPKGIVTTALIFDLDGTLVDTESFDNKLLKKVLRENKIKTAILFKGQNLDKYLESVVKKTKLRKKIKERFLSEYEIMLKNIQIEINAELVRYLRVGVSPLVALVTANNRKSTNQILKKSGLASYFEIIVTCDDVKNQKPHPEPYFKALRELNVSPENCIVFEDSDVGIKSALSAGMKNVRRVNY